MEIFLHHSLKLLVQTVPAVERLHRDIFCQTGGIRLGILGIGRYFREIVSEVYGYGGGRSFDNRNLEWSGFWTRHHAKPLSTRTNFHRYDGHPYQRIRTGDHLEPLGVIKFSDTTSCPYQISFFDV